MDVGNWLQKLGLEQYGLIFHDNDVDAQVLPHLTADDLISIGVSSLGHRRKLLAAIAALGAELRAGVPAASPAAPAPADAERRQLTVMFCDLVGSTALSARLDPEDLREIIGAYHRAVAGIVAGLDGFVARYMGDGVLVYFGYPQAHEDDAERAVRAGLGAVDAVGRLDVKSARLQTRVGIATGLVVVGDLIGEGSAQEQSVVGETPNLAARLQALAEPDAVVIAAGTRRLVGGLFDYRDLGAVELKGIARPVPVWQVLRPSVVASWFEALRGSALTRLIGRDEDIDLLLRRWARARAGDGQVVLISGEPGLGKSRMTAALEEHLHAEPHLRLRYYCSPYRRDSALFPFIDQLGRAAGFARDDPPAARLAKLEAALAPAMPPGEDVAFLADLLSLPASERHRLPDLSPQRKKERTLEALIRQLEGLARQQPVVMVFEDAHWIDPTSRELLDLAVERVRGLPVLMIVTFRPEFQPAWTGRPRVSTLTLNRLDQRDRTVLVEQIAGGKALPDEVVAQIVERADGVPLFVEELTKHVLESGLLREEAGRYVLNGPLSPFAIPTSLHDSLMARLDRQGPARQVAQIGAAIGRQFGYELLRAVARLPENELQASLARLVDAELIFQRGAPPEAVYTFKHALVQDAAHGSLLRSARQPLHGRIAEVLQVSFPDIAATQPEVVAYHLTEAQAYAQAILWWRRAGQRNVHASANLEATVHFSRCIALLESLPENAERDAIELDIRIDLGIALAGTSVYTAREWEPNTDRLLVLAERIAAADKLLPILWQQWRFVFSTCKDMDRALMLARHILAIAGSGGDEGSLVMAHRVLGMSLVGCGQVAEACHHLEHAIAHYVVDQHAGLADVFAFDQRLVAMAYLALALVQRGYIDQGRRMADQVHAETLSRDHAVTTGLVLSMRLGVHMLLRESEGLGATAADLLRLQTRHPHRGREVVAASALALLDARANGTESALAAAREGIDELRRLNWLFWVPWLQMMMLEIYLNRHRLDEARSLLDQLDDFIGSTGYALLKSELCRLRAELRQMMGETPAAIEGQFMLALDVGREQGAMLAQLRAATGLTRHFHDLGREDAPGLLEPILSWFNEATESPDVRLARSVLDALGQGCTKFAVRNAD